MAFIKNMKLRSKMTYGFSLSILLMLVALAFGIFGLWQSNGDIEMVNEITKEANVAAQIQHELLESQKVFKAYLLTGDTNANFVFSNHESNMERLMSDLKAININEERTTYIASVEESMTRYGNGFSNYQDLNKERERYYTSIGISGAELITNLDALSDIALENKDEFVQWNVGRGLENILLARLNAMKFFTFHTDPEYLAYQEAFTEFTNYIDGIKEQGKSIKYKSDYDAVQKKLVTYSNEMSLLHDLIKQMDEQVALMDETESEITKNIKLINDSVLLEQSQFENDVKAQSTMLTSVATIVAGIAIVVAVVISSLILKLVLVPIHSLRETFEGIAKGDVDLDFRLPEVSKDEIGLMSKAFNQFMVNLKKIMDDVNYQNWSKTAQNELNNVILDHDDLRGLSQSVLSYLCHYIDAQIGTIYLKGSEETLTMAASFAYTNRKGLQDSIQLGDGLVGQCALERKTFIVTDLPEEYMAVQSGLGSSQPTSIIVVPCVYEDELKCVIEIGTLRNLTDKELNLLSMLADAIAAALHSTDVRIRMKELLDKTMHQSEELQMQQEELRQSNEELEEQTRALKESEQRLQAQQEELRVSNEELEQRTKQLEHQRKSLDDNNKELMFKQQEIIEKAEALELANTYKSEFLANMSHELRTPLNSILVLSQLLSDRDNNTPLSEKEREFALTINTSGEDLLTLINDILDLSKVEAGHLDIHHDDIKLTTLLRESENMFVPMANAKKITFRTTIDDRLPEIMVTDNIRLQQIIKNLVSNAIKFTHTGEVILSLRKPTAFECDAMNYDVDEYIAVEVADTGIGIADDKQQLIFEAFRQTDGTTSRKYGGTGLGLTISRELSHLLGGQLMLESIHGEGSKFVFILPLISKGSNAVHKPVVGKKQSIHSEKENTVKSSLRNNESALSNLPDVQTDEYSTNNLLLIIEDDVNFASILAGLAEEKGFECKLAHTGENGLEIAVELKPSAIILDLGLPDVDGMELAEKLGRLNETKHIPIHIISGMEGDKKALLPSSVIGFLKKPVDIKTIYKTLAKIESVSNNDLKKLLVVGECGGETFEHFSSLGDVEVSKVLTGAEGSELLKSEAFECVVIDIELSDMSGEHFLAELTTVHGNIPVIIYSESEISNETLEGINKYTDSIILKSPKSEERLVDEVSLFLHGMSEGMKDNVEVSTARMTAVLDEIKHKVTEDDNFEGKKILVVDDDDRNVFALSNVLMKHGFDVIVAEDGLESIKLFKEERRIDLVLMDIMMPKMDGYEAIREIRNLDNGKHVPIIALTAKAMKDDREKCVAAGANDYMTKPIDIEKLISLLKVWLS